MSITCQTTAMFSRCPAERGVAGLHETGGDHDVGLHLLDASVRSDAISDCEVAQQARMQPGFPRGPHPRQRQLPHIEAALGEPRVRVAVLLRGTTTVSDTSLVRSAGASRRARLWGPPNIG